MTNPPEDRRANSPSATDRRSDSANRAGPVFWSGIVVGLLLAVGGGISLNQALVGNTTAQLILCSGLGIVFGAFGSTSTVKYKGAVITGVGAIAIILLLVVDHLIEDNYVELEITGDVDGAEIEIEGDENYLGAPRGRSHKFIIIGKEIRKTHLFVSITIQSDEEYIFECVDKSSIEPHLGSGQIIEWHFDQANARLVDSKRNVIAEVGGCLQRADAAPTNHGQDLTWLAGLAREFAIIAPAQAAEQGDVQELILKLESGSTYTRRKSRQQLGEQGLSAIDPLLEQLAGGDLSYRTRLGIIVAFATMLRENKAIRRDVSERLTTDDLRFFVDASIDKNRTVRIYATEFLYDLGDDRVLPLLFDRFDSAGDNGKYNLILILEGVYPYLSGEDRARTVQTLPDIRGDVGDKTKALIDQIVSQKSQDEQRYWVIVGSFTDQTAASAYSERINREDDSISAFVGKRKPNNQYYPVIVGDYVPRKQADELIATASELNSVADYGSAPYLSTYADRRP